MDIANLSKIILMPHVSEKTVMIAIATVDYLDPPMMLSYKKVLIVKEALISFEERYGV